MIALVIGYEAITRLFAPVPMHFTEAIPIAVVGLAVNVASAWLLSGGHHHGDSHGHGHDHPGQSDERRIATPDGVLVLTVFENGVPPMFRLRRQVGGPVGADVTVKTVRPDDARQVFAMLDRGGWLERVQTPLMSQPPPCI